MNDSADYEKRDSIGIYEDIIQPCLAELTGVAFFVFMGVASMASGNPLAIAVGHGLALALAVGSVGIISGGHLNPAVTIGVLWAHAISPILAGCYIVSQIVGAILGAALARGVLHYTPDGANETVYKSITAGVNKVGDDVTLGTAVLAEIVATAFLVMVVLMTAVRSRNQSEAVAAPMYIGLSVLVGILAIGSVSGGSLNPARSFGPALVGVDMGSKVWKRHWVFWVGPIVGSIISALIYRVFFAEPDKRVILKRH